MRMMLTIYCLCNETIFVAFCNSFAASCSVHT